MLPIFISLLWICGGSAFEKRSFLLRLDLCDFIFRQRMPHGVGKDGPGSEMTAGRKCTGRAGRAVLCSIPGSSLQISRRRISAMCSSPLGKSASVSCSRGLEVPAAPASCPPPIADAGTGALARRLRRAGGLAGAASRGACTSSRRALALVVTVQ